jgi:hypothetical protein
MKLRDVRPTGDETDDQVREAFGTLDWESFAAFLAGAEAHLSGNALQAKSCYLEALDKDSTNLKAQQNLSALRLYAESDDERELALTTLRAVRRRLR